MYYAIRQTLGGEIHAYGFSTRKDRERYKAEFPASLQIIKASEYRALLCSPAERMNVRSKRTGLLMTKQVVL